MAKSKRVHKIIPLEYTSFYYHLLGLWANGGKHKVKIRKVTNFDFDGDWHCVFIITLWHLLARQCKLVFQHDEHYLWKARGSYQILVSQLRNEMRCLQRIITWCVLQTWFVGQ